jgi:hypothetical protein
MEPYWLSRSPGQIFRRGDTPRFALPLFNSDFQNFIFVPPLPKGGGGYTVLTLSVQDIFRRIFLSNCWLQKSDIWSQASYRYTILWVAFLDLSDSYFLFADLVDFYTHICTFFSANIDGRNLIFGHKLHIPCRYPISWEAFLDPSDSHFLFVDFVDFYTHLTSILIFGHKLHIGMPYCEKCFWTRQIPTSCLPT